MNGYRSQVILATRRLMTVVAVVFGLLLSMPRLVGAGEDTSQTQQDREAARRAAAEASGQTQKPASQRASQIARDREATRREAAEAYLQNEIRRRGSQPQRGNSFNRQRFSRYGGSGGYGRIGGGGYGGSGGYSRGTSRGSKSSASRRQSESPEARRKANYEKNIARTKKREQDRRKKMIQEFEEIERLEKERARQTSPDLTSPFPLEILLSNAWRSLFRHLLQSFPP